ncbi:MAG: hypothetical protein V1784_01800, partial [bacterium]
MKTFIFMFLLAGIFIGLCLAQPPDSLWSRTFGGSYYEECYSVQQTLDGGYILGGYTLSFGAGDADLWLVKTDADGDSLWSRTFGGSNGDGLESMQQTSDGGYILAGSTRSFGVGAPTYANFWLVKTTANGDSLWSRTFGGTYDDYCFSVDLTSDGGYVLAGSTFCTPTNRDFWLVKTDENGDSLWSRTFGGTWEDACYCVQETADGGYILAGLTKSFGVGTPSYANIWLVKTNATGDSLWSRSFGGSRNDYCKSVRQTSDNGYILAGRTYSFGIGTPSYSNFWLLKTNADGDSIWSRAFGGSRDDLCLSTQQTLDGGYIMAGTTWSYGTGTPSFPNLWLVKTDA